MNCINWTQIELVVVVVVFCTHTAARCHRYLNVIPSRFTSLLQMKRFVYVGCFVISSLKYGRHEIIEKYVALLLANKYNTVFSVNIDMVMLRNTN